MLGFLGRLFGSDKAMAGMVDGLKSGLDALVYTDQEKERDAAKERAAARDMLIGWMDKTQGQNIARRFLALVITFVWLFQYLAAFGLGLAVVWVTDAAQAKRISESAEMVGGYADGMTGAMMLILGFYFAAPHLGSIIGPAMARFSKAPEPKKTSAS
jgi:hypothetical protein